MATMLTPGARAAACPSLNRRQDLNQAPAAKFAPEIVVNEAALRGAASAFIGGPISVGILTPQRNAMTLAAMELSLSYVGLYRAVFAEGPLKAFRGIPYPMLASVPQFAAIGPVYLACEAKGMPVPLAISAASVVESSLTYFAHRRNAQIQYNATRSAANAIPVSGVGLAYVMGPGFAWHVGRNIAGMAGIRVFSPWCKQMFERMPGGRNFSEAQLAFAGDLSASAFASTLSMPFNQVFSWCACTPALEKQSYIQRTRAGLGFLIGSYRQFGLRLLQRDLCIRISYTASLFTIYRTIERMIMQE